MAKSAAAQAMEEKNMGGKIVAAPSRLGAFFGEVRNEMRHVTSPNRKEVQGTTVVVLITVALFGVYFFIVDFALGKGIDKLLHYFSR
jgi:preprotein translocase subunit SecE